MAGGLRVLSSSDGFHVRMVIPHLMREPVGDTALSLLMLSSRT